MPEKTIDLYDITTPDGLIQTLDQMPSGYCFPMRRSEIQKALSELFGPECTESQAADFFACHGLFMKMNQPTTDGIGCIAVVRH